MSSGTRRPRRFRKTEREESLQLIFIWRFDYKLTKYKFNNTLHFKYISGQRGVQLQTIS